MPHWYQQEESWATHESRQCHLFGGRAHLWTPGRVWSLSKISKSQECVGFTGHVRDTGCCDGNEISQLLEVHASWPDGIDECPDVGEHWHWNAQKSSWCSKDHMNIEV